MRILVVHNHYRHRSGEDLSFAALVEALQARGNAVYTYACDNQSIDSRNLSLVGMKAVWNMKSYAGIRTAVAQSGAEIVHFVNVFPLISPAGYYGARSAGAAVVQALHNYRWLCPNALLFRAGRLCEDCLGLRFPWPGVIHGCYRSSRMASAAAAAMCGVHRYLGTLQSTVDQYIALTRFSARKHIEGGFPPNRMSVCPNFMPFDPGIGIAGGGFVFYAGRLAEEKGVDTLVEATQLWSSQVQLVIAGSGPYLSRLGQFVPGQARVRFLGDSPQQTLLDWMKSAEAVIVPSKCYEGLPRVIIEAFATGTPVIASNIGALPELVEHGRTGLLFRPGDAEDLAAKVDWFLSHPRQARAMRREARAEFEAKYTAERNYPLLMEIYERAIRHRRAAEDQPLPAADDLGHAPGWDKLPRRHPAGD